MRTIVLVVGVIAILLGGLWLFQGLGLVKLAPILCFANCAAVQGPSLTWVGIGAVTALLGAFGVFLSRKRPNAST